MRELFFNLFTKLAAELFGDLIPVLGDICEVFIGTGET
jgi:hypothetical protein